MLSFASLVPDLLVSRPDFTHACLRQTSPDGACACLDAFSMRRLSENEVDKGTACIRR